MKVTFCWVHELPGLVVFVEDQGLLRGFEPRAIQPHPIHGTTLLLV